MKFNRFAILAVLAAAGAVLWPGRSTSADTLQDQIDAIMKRIEARAPDVLRHKNAGAIGETWQGRLETVKPADDAAVNALVADENKDREELFKLLAKKENLSVEEVRKNFAVFRLKRAADHHYFKGRNGQWLTKKQWAEKGPPGPFDP